MSEGLADTATVEVNDASALAAREDDALVKGIAPLRVDETGAPQQLQRVPLSCEMTPQIPAGSVADLQFLDHNRIVHSALFEVPQRLRVARELPLIEGSRLLQQVSRVRRSDLQFEMSEALAEGEMSR
jgi:hypothetical protein